jgi:hypothetical protein
MLKERDQDAEVSKAEIEFYRVQKAEQQFHKDFGGLGTRRSDKTIFNLLSLF